MLHERTLRISSVEERSSNQKIPGNVGYSAYVQPVSRQSVKNFMNGYTVILGLQDIS